jgi:hypothetical protein
MSTRKGVSISLMLVCTVMLSSLSAVLPLSTAKADGNVSLVFAPAQSVVDFPQPVTVNVTLNNVANLAAWQVRVTFNSSMIVYSDTTIPSDDLLGLPGDWLNGAPVVVNSTTGYVIIYLSLNPGMVVNGSGTLCQVTFNVTQPGMSPLTFAGVGIPGPSGGTVLLDGDGDQIPFDHADGNVQMNSGPVASFTLTPSKPSVNATAIFDATSSSAGWSSSIPGYAPITNYTWDFGDGTPVNITSNATIQHVFTLTDNYSVVLTVTDSVSRTNQTSKLVEVINRSKLWDLDGDGGLTDMRDISIAAKAFGSTAGNPRWNPIADITGPVSLVPDGMVDMRDIALVAKHFGETE